MQRLGVEDFLEQSKEGQIVDVRSPAEYQKGHIPGALNIPIFTNQERAEVGTVYKQKSREEAIMLGLDIVGPKLRQIADKGKKLSHDGKLFIYCWRGGLRSEKMAWLFDLSGLQTKVLEGGYKSYRSHGKEVINQLEEYIIVQGPTGSGKTEIIRALAQLGEQVIDLEGLAHHKGSAFGGLGQEAQPSTQQFQNEIYQLLGNFDKKRPVWLESESATIGKVYLQEELWKQMNRATILAIDVPLKARIDNIINQYGKFPQDKLVKKVAQLHQKLGGAMVKEITDHIKQDDLKKAVEQLLYYYDKSYSFSARQNKINRPLALALPTINPLANAHALIEVHQKKPVNAG